MKKIISIVLIFSFVAPFWISYSIIQYEKYQTKKKVKKLIVSGLDKNQLVQLKFSNKEIKTKLMWEHSKEFEYRGVMYDVVESNSHGDSTYYWCWEDTRETELNIILNRLASNAVDANKKVNDNLKLLSSLLSSLYYSQTNQFDLNESNKSNRFIYIFIANCSSLYFSPLLPPPKPV